MSQVLAILALEPVDGQTRLTVWYGWIARGFTGRLAGPRITAYLATSYQALLPEIRRWLDDDAGKPWPLIRIPRSVAPGGRERASSIASRLRQEGCDGAAVERLVTHVLESDALDLDRVRPFALADDWGLERSEVLVTTLRATRAGLLRARWDVVCPHCRGVRTSLARLDELPLQERCEPCDVVFETGTTRLHLTFRIHESVRHVEPRVYCAAEAALKPHVRIQLVDTAAREVGIPLPVGIYALRTADFSMKARLEICDDGPERAIAEGAEVRLGVGGTLVFPTAARWLVESLDAPDDVVRPSDVLSIPEYREVMGDEQLGPDVALEMGRQTLLFTDVVGSTDLYRTLGDRAAFDAVRHHFAILFDLVHSEGGTVIKTIGDAVMAAFVAPEAALRAAQAIARADLGAISVRVSVHAGQCIAVNLDTGVDYFGSVVNETAKLQAAAGAGEVALSEELAAELQLTGHRREYGSGSQKSMAVVWVPAPDAGTPIPMRRRDR